MLVIDGAMGEGGGQVLRSALGLSALTGIPFRIEGIRRRRKKPGLLRQHLTAVRAAREICDAHVSGEALGASELVFEPRAVRHGEHEFAIGTAGSATLVLQTVLPPLLATEGRSRLCLEGGTHNPMAPSFDFVVQTFLPLLARMGARVTAALIRPGFYPAGGGRLEVDIEGGLPLSPLTLLARGDIRRARARAVVSNLPAHIARRELETLAHQLADLPLELETAAVESPGPGNALSVTLFAEHVTETFTGFGETGVRAETVAHRLAGEVRRYLASGAAVGEHLADQLLIPLALAGSGAFSTSPPSSHTMTNLALVDLFLPGRLRLEQANVIACGPAS